MLATPPLMLAAAAVLVVGLSLGALRCIGLAVSLWTYDVALSALAAALALALGGGAAAAALRVAGPAARALIG